VSRRKRWGIGVAIFFSAYVVGYLVSRDPSMGHLGGAIALVGMAVLSWLVPFLLTKRPTAEEREIERERQKTERLEALTVGRPGYGQLRNLVVRVADDTSTFLWKVERDGICDVVSATTGSAKVGGYGQQYIYTEFLLRMKPRRSVGASAQDIHEQADAERREREGSRGAA
jgi:hypothetical protein